MSFTKRVGVSGIVAATLVFCGVFRVASAAVSLTESEKWLKDFLVPGSEVHPDRVSQSGWLWNSEAAVANDEESFFRLRFSLPSAPKSASFKFRFDDGGAIWLNGKRLPYDTRNTRVPEKPLLSTLTAGENTLAVSLKNSRGPSGIVFLMEIGLADGSTVFVHSDESVKAVSKAPKGWQMPGFDDSSWPAAVVQADAVGLPWSNANWATRGVLEAFLTREERRKYDEEERRACELPAGFEAGPEPNARIVHVDNLPMIEVAGKVCDPDWNLSGVITPWRTSVIRKIAPLGIDISQIRCSSDNFETAPGKYDFSEFDRSAKMVFRMNPRAMLIVSPIMNLSKWLAEHPDEAMAYAAGPVVPGAREHYGRPLRPSAASEAYREQACRALAEFCEWVKRQPWGNRVIAVRPNWGTYCEWHVYGMWDGPDVGLRMAEAFRRYKGGKWAGAEPPTMAERASGRFLLDPVANAKAIDFFECQQEQVADLAAVFARTIKTHLPGRLVGMWYGYVLTAQAPEGANVLLDRVLSNPDIDFLTDPAIYMPESRRAGGSFMHRTVPATYTRYGKLCILEDDSRYHHLKPWATPKYALHTPEESRAAMLRNYLSKLFDLCGIQFNDACLGVKRPTQLDNEVVLKALSDAQAAFRRARQYVTADSGADTAFVVDYFGRFQWDAQSRQKVKTGSLLFDFSPVAVHKSGSAFDILTVQDYLASPKKYSTVAFLNMFYPREGDLSAVKAKLAKDGATAIRLAPPDTPEVDLGVKTIAARDVPVTGEAWAALFKEAGVHAYTAPGSYFRRRGDLMMFCTGTAGVHTITLPASDAGKRFEDLVNGGEYAAPTITLKAEGPKTWLFAPKRR